VLIPSQPLQPPMCSASCCTTYHHHHVTVPVPPHGPRVCENGLRVCENGLRVCENGRVLANWGLVIRVYLTRCVHPQSQFQNWMHYLMFQVLPVGAVCNTTQLVKPVRAQWPAIPVSQGTYWSVRVHTSQSGSSQVMMIS
jgi:hypothetical protein